MTTLSGWTVADGIATNPRTPLIVAKRGDYWTVIRAGVVLAQNHNLYRAVRTASVLGGIYA